MARASVPDQDNHISRPHLPASTGSPIDRCELPSLATNLRFAAGTGHESTGPIARRSFSTAVALH